ncbi:apolipoprotein C-IV [Mugil cephalus]|uniref:apolipoprotein C-IV n=1 Tax=Mugil cephalus TaxID=48193 RepID=UPI001FB78D57|nr:apolipoprotein C-IV [Mugil cephalus]
MMHIKPFVLSLLLLMQACGPLLAQTATPTEPDSPGILQKLAEKARAARTRFRDLGDLALGFAGAFYEDHIQPVTDSYAQWASDVKSSVWEKIQITIDDYTPFKGTSPTEPPPLN